MAAIAETRKSWATAAILFIAGFVIVFAVWPQVVSAAQYSFNSQEYPNIGWKQRAVLSTPIPTAHMDNGGAYCGTSLDQDFTDGIVWWNGQGTAGLFQFATSTCNAISFPSVRVVPYRVYKPSDPYFGRVAIYDKDPVSGQFYYCLVSCNRGENSSTGAQTGYDLAEILFNGYHSFDAEWVSKHELAHVLGQQDQYTGSSCNSSYVGLLDNYLCHQSLTQAEKDSVDDTND